MTLGLFYVVLVLCGVPIVCAAAGLPFVGHGPNGELVINSVADQPVLINGVDVLTQVANLTAAVTQLLTAFGDANPAFTPALLVSGADLEVVNGPYKRDGMSGGRPVYVKVETDGRLFVSPNDAQVWIAFGTTNSLSITPGNAITGSCGCAVACGSPTNIGGAGVYTCGVASFVHTVSMTTVSTWTIGDSNGMAYFTSTSSSSGGRPPTQWSPGANGLGPTPSLAFE